MNNFTCNIAHNRIDCSWTYNGILKSKSITIEEIQELSELTDNSFIFYTQDTSGDLTYPQNMVMRHREQPILTFNQVINEVVSNNQGIAVMLPFKELSSFEHVGIFPLSQPLPYFFKHWYQPIVLSTCILSKKQSQNIVFVKAIIDNEYTTRKCHMTAMLQNAHTSKDCSEYLAATTFTVSGEYSLAIDTSKMTDRDIYVLRVRSQGSTSLSGAACCNVILRVRSDV